MNKKEKMSSSDSDMPLTLQCIACGEEMEKERLGVTGDILDTSEETRASIKMQDLIW